MSDNDAGAGAGGSDEVWRRNEPDSPCVKICLIDPASRFCIGCGRTGEEIAAWTRLDAAGRAAIRAQLPARMAELAPKRGAGRVRRRRRDDA